MKLALFQHGDYICGHRYSCQASWKKEDVGVPTLTQKLIQKVLVISAQIPMYLNFGHIGVPKGNCRG